MAGSIGLLLCVCLLAGCAMSPREIDLSGYARTTADEAMAACMPPNYVVDRKAPRVAILQFDDHSETNFNLGKLATEAFHNMTADMGRFQVIERAQAQKFADELGYQEEHGGSWENFEGNYAALGQDVDYIIVGAVKRVMPNVSQKPASTDSKGNYIAPKCEASVEVSVSARVISTRTGLTLRTFEMQDCETHIQQRACRATPGMAQKALEKAIRYSGSVKMAQAIPVYGYVKRLLSCTHDHQGRVAYINLGRGDGIKPGDEIVAMKTEEDIDPINGRHDVRFVDIAKGCVAKNGLCETESIVIFDDEKKAPTVKVGHVVSPTARRAIMEANNKKLKESWTKIMDTVLR
jgi:curli biogenesis system outer membrane secretion channel CsgG